MKSLNSIRESHKNIKILEFHMIITKILELIEFRTRTTKIMKIFKFSIENNCYEHIRISREIMKLMKILEFKARMMKIMRTIEFHKRIMKIMKINEFQLKNNENHENPIISQ